MLNDPGFGVIRFLASFLLAGGVLAGSVQSGQPLSALTVPAAALTSGCALKPPAPTHAPITRGGVIVINGAMLSPFPSNPWFGTDRRIVAAVHMAIDAAPGRPLPDVPPPTTARAAASKPNMAENILEAYHAAYVSAYGDQVEVFAVTFNDVKLATAPEPLSAMLNKPRGLTSRMVRGATVVRVSAPSPTECFAAVRTYIESLK